MTQVQPSVKSDEMTVEHLRAALKGVEKEIAKRGSVHTFAERANLEEKAEILRKRIDES